MGAALPVPYPADRPSCDTPDPPNPANTQIYKCGVGTITITATMGLMPGTEMRLYDSPFGGNLLATDATFPYWLSADLNAPGNYTLYLESYNSNGAGCASSRVPIEITVTNDIAPDPPFAADIVSCIGGLGVFTANVAQFSPLNDNVTLYDENGFFVASANDEPLYLKVYGVFTTTTYYMELVQANGCASDRVPVIVNVTGQAAQSLVISPQFPIICEGATLQMTGNSIPGTLRYEWSKDNIFLGEGLTYTRPNATFLDAGNYEFVAISINCTSLAQAFVDVKAAPPAPTLPIDNVQGCAGQSVTLQVDPQPGANFLWSGPLGYSAAGQTVSVPNLSVNRAGEYSVTAIVDGCQSPPVSLEVLVIPNPGPPFATDINGCVPASYVFTAFTGSPPGDEVRLYAEPLGGLPLAVASTNPYLLATPTVSTTTVFFLESVLTAQGCVSPRTPVSINAITQPDFTASNSGLVCEGQSIQLFAGFVAGGSYLWQGPDGFSTTDANPIRNNVTVAMSGVYTCTVTIPNCPPIVRNTTVRINPSPQNLMPTSNAPVCQGQTLFLNAPNVPGATFFWQGPGISSSETNLQIPNVQPGNAGTYNLTINTIDCGAFQQSINITVNAQPASPVFANKTYCPGEVITLEAPAPFVPGATYTWRNQNNIVIANDPIWAIPNASAAQAGVYSLRIELPGCIPAIGNQTIIVRPDPNDFIATPETTYACKGSSFTLSANQIPEATYEWLDATATPGSNLPSFTIFNADPLFDNGNFLVSVQVANCPVRTFSYPVVVQDPPAVPLPCSNSPICAGGVLELTAYCGSVAAAQTSYLWEGPQGVIPSGQETQPTLQLGNIPAGNHLFRITASTGVGCPPQSSEIRILAGENIPDFSIDNAAFCQGAPINFAPNPLPVLNNASYVWSTPTMQEFNTPTLFIAAASSSDAGVYSLTIQTPGCAPVQRSGVVTVYENVAGEITSSRPFPICEGSSLILTFVPQNVVPPNTVYQWKDPEQTILASTTNFQALPAPINGFYTLNVTSICNSIDRQIEVKIIPANFSVSASAIDASLCEGESLELRGQVSGIIDGARYVWRGPGDITVGTTPNVLLSDITSARAGSYVFEVTLPDAPPACSLFTSSTNIDVSPKPLLSSITLSRPSYCVGNTLDLLLDTPTPGATYTWSGPDNFSDNVSSPSRPNLTASHRGVYSLVITTPNCPPLTLESPLVEVYQTPVLAPLPDTVRVCEGDPINWRAQITPDYANAIYEWQAPGGAVINTSPLLTLGAAQVTEAGVYTLRILNPSAPLACGLITQNIVLQVSVRPRNLQVIAPSKICQGATLSLALSSLLPGATYNWNGPSGFAIAGGEVQIANMDIPNSGIYTVTVQTPACPALQVASSFIQVYRAPVITASATPSRVCQGQPIAFNAGAVPNPVFSWSGPGGFSSAEQNPVLQSAGQNSQGIFVVVATDTLAPVGCNTASANVAVTVAPAPQDPGIATNSPICVGNDLQFNLTNIQPEAAYVWSGPVGFASTEANATIANAQLNNAGIYTLTITTGPECLPLILFSERVQINAPPTGALTSNSPVCIGGVISLQAPAISNASYQWLQPDNQTINSVSPTLSLNNVGIEKNGSYFVTVTVPGCPSLPLSANVLVNQVPVIALQTQENKRAYCFGESVNLSANLLGVHQGTYRWNGPGNFTSVDLNPIIFNASTSASGIYSFTAFIPGCDTVTSSLAITVNELPSYTATANADLHCQGGTLQLNATNVPGASYQWSGPEGFSSILASAARVNLQPSHSGIYRVGVSVPGCNEVAQELSITVNPLPVPAAFNNGPVCEGNSLTLTGNYNPESPGATYAWNGPLAWSSAERNPLVNNISAAAAGNYTFTVLVPGCPPVSATTQALVNRLPVVSVTSNSPVCNVRSFLQFSATVTPESPNTTYLWSGPGGFSSNQKNPSISGITNQTAGTYALTVQTPGCNAVTATTVVSVTELPASIALQSNSPVCVGGTLRLTATSTSAPASYEWRAPGGLVVTTSDPNWTVPNFTESQSGEYSVTLTVLGCTETRTATTPVAITPVVSLGNSGPVCVGGVLRLTANAPQGATYRWDGPGGLTSTEPSPVFTNVTLANAGIYTLTVDVPGSSCGPIRLNTTVAVNTQVAAVSATNNGPVCAGGVLRLSASGIPGAVYAWSGPNGFVSEAQLAEIQNVQVNATGTYTLRVTPVGCSTVVASTVAVVHPIPRKPIVQGETTVCAGSALQLTVANEQGVEYAWQTPDGQIINDAILLRRRTTPEMSGVYALYTKLGSCSSEVVLTRVTIVESPVAPSAGANSPVCVGSALQLTASSITPGVTYRWLGPGGFTSAEQNPRLENISEANAGIYTVIAAVSACEALPVTVTVSVSGPIPPVSINYSSPLCEGDILRLAATEVPGATYSWNGPNGFTSSNSNISLAGVGALNTGLYEVTVSLTGCSSVKASADVIVNRAPGKLSVSNNGPICEGQNLEFGITPAQGATYFWSGPAAFIATDQNPILPVARLSNSGNYSVTVTVPGCPPTTLVTAARVKLQPAAPVITSNSPVCSGGNLVLGLASLLPDAIYFWQDPAGNTSFAPRLTRNNASALDAGNYSVFTILEGCTSATSLQNVEVLETPNFVGISNNSPICSGNALFIEAEPIPGARYLWSGPNNFSATGAILTLSNATVAASGVYSLNVALGSCTSRVFTTNITVNVPPRTPVPVSANSPICAGENLNLTVAGSVGATYLWSGPNGFTSTLTNPTIAAATLSNAGEYTVTVTVQGCAPLSGIVNAVINDIPSSVSATNNSPVCVGGNLVLSASAIPGATYQWSGPGGFSSNLPNPSLSNVNLTQGGVYSLVVRVANCQNTLSATTAVVINAQPRVTLSSNSPVCQGNTLSLTPSLQNANWSYVWQGPGGNVGNESVLNIINAAPTDGGVYTLSVTAQGCAPTQATARVTVNPNATSVSVSNNSPVCAGRSVTLSSTGIPAGSVLSWQGPNGYRSSLASPSFMATNVSQGGVYTLSVLIPGCTAQSFTTTVVVNLVPPLPIPAANSPLCQGGELNLSVTPAPGVSYFWQGPANFNAITESGTIADVTLLNAGVYSVVAFIGECSSAAATLNVQVNPIPAAPSLETIQAACLTGKVQLTATAPGASQYYWEGPNGFVSTSQSPTIPSFAFENAGFYSVVAIANNCTSAVAQTELVSALSADVRAITGDTVLCEGGILNLGVSPTPGAIYTWRGPNNYSSMGNSFAIVDALPNQSGVYTITATLGSCTSIATRNVTVIRKPPAPRLFSNSPLCSGGTLQLSSDGPANGMYIWQGPAGFFSMAPNPTRPNVTIQHAGTYTLQMFADDCPAPAVSINVTVTGPSATFNLADVAICQGETINVPVVAQGVPAWVVNYTANGVQQNPIIIGTTAATNVVLQPTQTTTYIINNVRDGSACAGSFRDTLVVTVVQRPVAPRAGANSPVCLGGTLVLSVDDINPNFTYFWRGPNGFTHIGSSAALQNASVANSGVYSVVAIQGACSSAITRVNTAISSGPVATMQAASATVCTLQPYAVTVNLTGTPPWSLFYQISGGPTFTVNNITSSPYVLNLTPPATGVFTYTLVDVFDASGCIGGASGAVTLNSVNRSTINVVRKTDASCGGSNGSLQVQATAGSGGGYLYSIDGVNFNNTTGTFNNLAAGTYTISVRDGSCISATTVAISGGVSPPTITSGSGGGGSISVTWEALVGVAGYNLRYRVAGSGGAYQTISNITGNSRTVTGLLPNTAYEVQVQTVCSNGSVSAWSAATDIVTLDTGASACATPGNLSFHTLRSTSLTITWGAVSGVVCYVVSYGNIGSDPTTWLQVLVPGNTLSITGLTPGVSYGYRVRTNCSSCSATAGSLSAWSVIGSFTTPITRESDVQDVASANRPMVYPNPTQGRFTISFNQVPKGNIYLKLFDMQGKVVEEQEITSAGNESAFTLDWQGLHPQGLYLLEIREGGRNYRLKLAIE